MATGPARARRSRTSIPQLTVLVHVIPWRFGPKCRPLGRAELVPQVRRCCCSYRERELSLERSFLSAGVTPAEHFCGIQGVETESPVVPRSCLYSLALSSAGRRGRSAYRWKALEQAKPSSGALLSDCQNFQVILTKTWSYFGPKRNTGTYIVFQMTLTG